MNEKQHLDNSRDKVIEVIPFIIFIAYTPTSNLLKKEVINDFNQYQYNDILIS